MNRNAEPCLFSSCGTFECVVFRGQIVRSRSSAKVMQWIANNANVERFRMIEMCMNKFGVCVLDTQTPTSHPSHRWAPMQSYARDFASDKLL